MPGSDLRIAIVSRYPPLGTTHAGRGIASYSKQLAEALVRTGAETVVFAEQKSRGPEGYVDNGVTVRRVWRDGLGAAHQVREALAKAGPFSLIHIQHELFAFGRREGALAAVGLLRNVHRIYPVVATIHGVIPMSAFNRDFSRSYAGMLPPRLVQIAYRFIMRMTVRATDLVIVNQREVLKSLLEYEAPRRSAVIPHGVERMRTKPDREASLRLLGLTDAKRAVFLGFRLPYKGIETLEAAIPLLSESGIEVLIAGGPSGDDRPTHVQRLSSRKGGEARQMGFIPEDLLPALFAVTDVLVLPYTVGLSASGPLSLAATFEVPVAVSNVETLSGQLRCPIATFRAGDSVALAETVRRLVFDSEARASVRTCLAAIRDQCGWTDVARLHLRAYAQVAVPGVERSESAVLDHE